MDPDGLGEPGWGGPGGWGPVPPGGPGFPGGLDSSDPGKSNPLLTRLGSKQRIMISSWNM